MSDEQGYYSEILREKDKELAALKLENEKLVELVGRTLHWTFKGEHEGDCRWWTGNEPCSCGLSALRAEIERVKGANPQTNFNQT